MLAAPREHRRRIEEPEHAERVGRRDVGPGGDGEDVGDERGEAEQAAFEESPAAGGLEAVFELHSDVTPFFEEIIFRGRQRCDLWRELRLGPKLAFDPAARIVRDDAQFARARAEAEAVRGDGCEP